MNNIIFVMGVSGSGKTQIGQLLARELSIPFIDADDYHPESNIQKMKSGLPLNDDDRQPWLVALNTVAKDHLAKGVVIACSALKEAYRKVLMRSIEPHVAWIYLKGSYELIQSRMEARSGHFMKATLLQSQFDTLEEPSYGWTIDISDSPDNIVSKIKNLLFMKAEIGVFGLGVMGGSLSRNLARNGFRVALYNRHVTGQEEGIAQGYVETYPELGNAQPFDDMQAFVLSLEKPRKILVMVNAGVLDNVIEQLTQYLEPGDIIIDGGNSHFDESNRRMESLKSKGIHFIGTGVSGGEKGALNGPSIMPSGDPVAYTAIERFLLAIAAKNDEDDPCCTYIGKEGSGHFVKMVHNGIEYAEMQLLAECYSILKSQGQSNDQIADVLESWRPDLDSYLLKITVDILRKKDKDGYLLDHVLDKAGNKGTGKWTTIAIADYGEPATMIPSALLARYLSFYKEKRQQMATLYPNRSSAQVAISADHLKEGYRFARIINHHQGFSLIGNVSDKNQWNINLSEVARIWTAGCIIQSKLMKHLVAVLQTGSSLLSHPEVATIVKNSHLPAKQLATACLINEIHAPCFIEAINYFHGLKTADSSANMIQAQRDYFGAHTYERKDDPSGKKYHSDWEGA